MHVLGQYCGLVVEVHILAICGNNVAISKYCRWLLHFQAEARRCLGVHVAVVAPGGEFQFHVGNMQRKCEIAGVCRGTELNARVREKVHMCGFIPDDSRVF